MLPCTLGREARSESEGREEDDLEALGALGQVRVALDPTEAVHVDKQARQEFACRVRAKTQLLCGWGREKERRKGGKGG